jgi:hypothetical protein
MLTKDSAHEGCAAGLARTTGMCHRACLEMFWRKWIAGQN